MLLFFTNFLSDYPFICLFNFLLFSICLYVCQLAVSIVICFCLYAIFSCLTVLLNLCILTFCASFYWLKLSLFLCPPCACSLCLNFSVYVSICFIICLTLTEQNGDLSLVILSFFFSTVPLA